MQEVCHTGNVSVANSKGNTRGRSRHENNTEGSRLPNVAPSRGPVAKMSKCLYRDCINMGIGDGRLTAGLPYSHFIIHDNNRYIHNSFGIRSKTLMHSYVLQINSL